MTTPSPRAPQRCFILDLPRVYALQKETKIATLVRVMGMVVSMEKVVNNNSNNNEDNIESYYAAADQDDWMLLELDDGTGTIPIHLPTVMMERLVALRVGQTLDCIGALKRVEEEEHDTLLIIRADTLLEVPRNHKDPEIAERLRWMEVTNQNKISWCGYPCPQISSEYVFQVIESNNGEGVTCADLALVLDLEPEQVQALIEDLQLQGLIYENETGTFVPL